MAPPYPWSSRRVGRERILLYAMGGAGKSTAIQSIAQMVLGHATVHVVDTDYAWDVMHEGLPSITPHYVDADDWQGLMDEIAAVTKISGPNDWLVIDSMTPSWQAVQDEYVQRIHGKDIEAYFVEARKATKSKSLEAFEGAKDWSVINSMYNKLYMAIMKYPGHVLLTAEADAIGDKDKKDIKDMFTKVGRKPKGQKGLSFRTHTTIYMFKEGAGVYKMTTVKDRDSPTYRRDDMVEKQVELEGGFALGYLWQVAGWRPAPADEIVRG